MSPTKTTSFRLQPATIEKIKSLARQHETMAGVIERAIALLELSPSTPDAPHLESRIQSIEERLDALEQYRTTCLNQIALTSSGVSPAPKKSVPATGKRYGDDVAAMAVQMRRDGKTAREIKDRIQDLAGYSPDLNNMTRTLDKWSRRFD
jgi:hypothetical protein